MARTANATTTRGSTKPGVPRSSPSSVNGPAGVVRRLVVVADEVVAVVGHMDEPVGVVVMLVGVVVWAASEPVVDVGNVVTGVEVVGKAEDVVGHIMVLVVVPVGVVVDVIVGVCAVPELANATAIVTRRRATGAMNVRERILGWVRRDIGVRQRPHHPPLNPSVTNKCCPNAHRGLPEVGSC